MCSKAGLLLVRVQELCESRGGRPGLPVANSTHGLCRRKAASNLNVTCKAAALSLSSLKDLYIWERGGE